MFALIGESGVMTPFIFSLGTCSNTNFVFGQLFKRPLLFKPSKILDPVPLNEFEIQFCGMYNWQVAFAGSGPILR